MNLHLINKKNVGAFALTFFINTVASASGLSVSELRTQRLINPIGIDDSIPQFSWILHEDEDNAIQHTYRIVVTNSDGIVVWDSGNKTSEQSVAISYAGQRLQPSTKYHWSVTVTDNKGNTATSDENATFETGLFDTGWKGAAWLSAANDSRDRSCPLFRKTFTINNKVKEARLYTTSLGVHDVYINGQRAGITNSEDSTIYCELKPGCTLYDKTLYYVTSDVTRLLQQGSNAIGAQVAAGWWSGPISTEMYGSWPPLAFRALLLISYEDGSQQAIVTDGSWKASATSALTLGDIYDGEDYDARIAEPYSTAAYNDNQWSTPKLNAVWRYLHGKVRAWQGPLVKVRPAFTPKHIKLKVYNGTTPTGTDYGMLKERIDKPSKLPVVLRNGDRIVFDFGQNMVGWVRFKAKADKGTKLTFRFGEMLNDTGSKGRGNDGPGNSVYLTNLRSARATLNYTFAGDVNGESYQPWSTYFGFRYCEITATDSVELTELQPEVVGSDVEEDGSIDTNDSRVDKLYSNLRWGQRGNFLSIPTDCPQRNERSGWTADTHIFSTTAMYNADCYSFYRKWLGDLRDSQRSTGAYPDVAPLAANRGIQYSNGAWGDAGIIVPWNVYLMYGDKQILQEHYASMKRYMDYLSEQAGDGYLYNGPGITYGDWCAYTETDKRFISVCFYAHDADLMAHMAQALSTSDNDEYAHDAEAYKTLFNNIKEEFAQRYLNNGVPTQTTMTALLLPLHFNLLPNEESRKACIKLLRERIESNNYKLNTGFVGTAYLTEALSETGCDDLAYDLLLQRGNPSWLYSVDQGATTIWERWDSYTSAKGFGDAGMNSFNHYAYGAIGEWMYRYMAGMQPDAEQPGWKHFFLRPHFDNRKSMPRGQQQIKHVEASFKSPYGIVSSKWKLNSDSTWTYECTIPVGTTATLHLPSGDYELSSGKYTFNTGETNGIKEVLKQSGYEELCIKDDSIYNLQGIRIAEKGDCKPPFSGIFIKSGKKIIVRR